MMISSAKVSDPTQAPLLRYPIFRLSTLFPLTLIVAPIVLFYTLVSRELVNLPFLDDYGAVLGFLTNWRQIHSVGGRVMYILTAQHNEYKIMFAHGVFALQYVICGHANFIILSIIGNLTILGIFVVLYKMWESDQTLSAQPLLLFAPVAWLLFQLQYYSLLNWPMSSLQNAAIVVFALWSIYFLGKGSAGSFAGALMALVLAIASSGNGLFVVPVGMLMLLQSRQWKRLLMWVAIAALMSALYFYKYNFHASQAQPEGSVTSALGHPSVTYMLGFLGSSVAIYTVNAPVIILGIFFLGLFAVMVWQKVYRTSPMIFYSVCFILITAVAVSGLRSAFGVDQSLASRYRIYSNLVLIFAYLYFVARFGPALASAWRRNIISALVLCAAIAFSLASTRAGFKLLRIKTQGTIEGVRRWEHGEAPITFADEGPHEDPVIRRQRLNGNFAPQEGFLRTAMEEGIYTPPNY